MRDVCGDRARALEDAQGERGARATVDRLQNPLPLEDFNHRSVIRLARARVGVVRRRARARDGRGVHRLHRDRAARDEVCGRRALVGSRESGGGARRRRRRDVEVLAVFGTSSGIGTSNGVNR